MTTANDIKKRDKTQKGFGHWNSFLKSAEYQAMVPGQREISEEELALHNKPGDMWIALFHNSRICVFDMTRFADFHPGGYSILANVAGKNATEEFRLAHAYVSPNMIGHFQQGYLIRSAFKSPNSLSPGAVMQPPVRRPPKSKPRWDWTETNGTVTLKWDLPRPLQQKLSHVVLRCAGDLMKLRVWLDTDFYLFEIKLRDGLEAMLDSLHYNESVFELSVTLSNSSSSRVPNLGAVEVDKIVSCLDPEADDGEYLTCSVAGFRDLNRDCRELTLDWPVCARVGIPIGHHIIVRATLAGDEVQKPYTPVCVLSPSATTTNRQVTLMVKRYPDGQMSPYIHTLDEDTKVQLSLPLGKLPSPPWLSTKPAPVATPALERQYTELVLVAAGSGITPMLRLLVSCLTNSNYKVTLMFFNRTERDIIYQEEWEPLQKFFSKRLQVVHILSQPGPKWTGATGRISDSTLRKLLSHQSNVAIKDAGRLIMVCGPSGFNKTTIQILKSWELSEEDFWEFKG